MEIMSYKPPRGSKGHKALSSIYRASVSAYSGDHKEASEHIKQAHAHVGEHVKELTESGKHDEATSFNTEAQKLLKRLDGIMKRTKNFWPSRTKKSETANNDLNKVDVKKPYPNLASTQKKTLNTHPGFNPNVDYKAFHELSPEDKKKALHAFGQKDMESHLYAHDRKSGEMIHGQRWKAPAEMLKERKPKANEPFSFVDPVRPQISPQHRQGAGVRVNAQGHEMHGKLGIVQLPNPNVPNKVGVRLENNGRFETHYFDHDQVSLSKPHDEFKKNETEDTKSHEEILTEAKNVLDFIRKKKE